MNLIQMKGLRRARVLSHEFIFRVLLLAAEAAPSRTTSSRRRRVVGVAAISQEGSLRDPARTPKIK